MKATGESSDRNGFVALMPLYLSLYLVLFAIFILLSTFSKREEMRMSAVMGSLNSVFPSSRFNAPEDRNALMSETGDLTPGMVIQERLGGLFAQAVPLAEYRILHKARLMEAVFPAEEIFLQDAAEFRSSSVPLLSHLAGVLASEISENGDRLEMTIFAHVDGKSGNIQDLAATRVGNFAQAMLRQGAPVGSVSVALRSGKKNAIRLEFRVLSKVRHENGPKEKVR